MLDADRKLRHGTVCIKVGSAVVAPDGLLSEAEVGRLARELCAVREAGARVVLVSSGAVACGLSAMGLPGMPDRMSDRQAAAAAGQPALMAAWSAAFGAFGVRVGQILLTADDIEDRARFINARRTLGALMDAGVVPIVNENDSVSFDELRVGDNDRLSAFAAGLCGASLLVLLSAAPGLCEGGPGGPVLGEVLNIADATEHVSSERSSTGVGGMATKLDAAHLARDMGIETVIAPGRVCDAERDSVLRIVRGDAIGTRFPVPDTDGVRGGMGLARKHWIGAAARPRGVIEVDAG
ncbi:MAG: glutamate 5-kinase, partial [Planctomycetota bacterium]